MVARSVAALANGPNRAARLRREHERLLLPRLRRHQAALRRGRRPPAASSGCPVPGPRAVRSRAGARCDRGISSARTCPTHPLAGRCEHVAAARDYWRRPRDEVPLRPVRQPDEAADASARPTAARSRSSTLPRVRLRDGDAHQPVRDPGRPVAGRADRPGRRGGVERAAQPKLPVHRDGRGADRPPPAAGRRGRYPSGGPPQPKPGSPNIPEFVRPMARTASRSSPRESGAAEVDEQILDAAREFFGM